MAALRDVLKLRLKLSRMSPDRMRVRTLVARTNSSALECEEIRDLITLRPTRFTFRRTLIFLVFQNL